MADGITGAIYSFPWRAPVAGWVGSIVGSLVITVLCRLIYGPLNAWIPMAVVFAGLGLTPAGLAIRSGWRQAVLFSALSAPTFIGMVAMGLLSAR